MRPRAISPLAGALRLAAVAAAILAAPSRAAAQPAPADSLAAEAAPAAAAPLAAPTPTPAPAPPPTPAAAAERAAIDSLNAYWRNLDLGWYEPLSPSLLAPGPGRAQLDSLGRAGDAELARRFGGHAWSFDLSELGRLDFNRCEGLRPGAALKVRRLARHGASLEVGLGYGISRKKLVWDAAVTVPQKIAWPSLDDGQRTAVAARSSWPLLTWDLALADRVQHFGGLQTLVGFLDRVATGQDHLHYYRLRYSRVGLTWKPRPRFDVRAGALLESHRALPVATDWNLENDAARVRPNLAIEPTDQRGLLFGLGASSRRISARLDFTALWLDDDGAGLVTAATRRDEDGGPDHARLEASARGFWIDRHGHELELRAACHAASSQEPLESRAWLGGYGTLRGFPEQELVGDQAAWASLDLRLGWDPLRATGLPLLKRLGLQPLAFADWGTARQLDGLFQGFGRDGERANVGLGLGKVLLGAGAGGFLRLFAARPVGYGQSDRDWQYLLEVEL